MEREEVESGIVVRKLKLEPGENTESTKTFQECRNFASSNVGYNGGLRIMCELPLNFLLWPRDFSGSILYSFGYRI